MRNAAVLQIAQLNAKLVLGSVLDQLFGLRFTKSIHTSPVVAFSLCSVADYSKWN